MEEVGLLYLYAVAGSVDLVPTTRPGTVHSGHQDPESLLAQPPRLLLLAQAWQRERIGTESSVHMMYLPGT